MKNLENETKEIKKTKRRVTTRKSKKETDYEKSQNIPNEIVEIVNHLKENRFTPEREYWGKISFLAEYLGLTINQTMLFASVFALYFNTGLNPVSFYRVADFYEIDVISFMRNLSDFNEIVNRGLFEKEESDNESVKIPKIVSDSIFANKNIPSLVSTKSKLAKTILDISNHLKSCHFKEQGLYVKKIEEIGNYLGTNTIQTKLFCAIFALYFNNAKNPIQFLRLSDFYQIDALEFLSYRNEFLQVIDKGLFEKFNEEEDSVKIPKFVSDAIFSDKKIPSDGSDSQTKGILRDISRTIVSLKRNNFINDKTVFLNNSIKNIAEYLDVTEIQAILFASVFTMYFDNTGRPISFYQIADFYQTNPLIIFQYREEMKALVEKGYVEEIDAPDDAYSNAFYKIPSFVADAICKNEKIDPLKNAKTLTIQTFIHQIEKIGDKRIDSGARIQTLYEQIESKEKIHKNVKSIEEVKKVLPKIENRSILYDVAAGMINHINTEVELMILINRNTDESTGRQMILQSFMDESHPLFTLDLLQFENKASMMDSTVSLTDKAFELILGDEGKFYQKKVSDKQLKSPDKIQEKELFYMPENEKEIKKLYNSLEKENLKNLQKRLEERKLPKGICMMFYGEPGTGKTETVYQMAKKTGRSIFHVDIGNMRSQWYGETEQKFSKLFNDYRKMCESAVKNDKLLPILLFNEADAIFGKRVENAQSGGRVDNTIQNILLEEMEKLPGILIATTNLEENLDVAFERRFLFKIKFAKPNTEIKSKIWKSNLNWLSDEQAKILAKDYQFSGGEIANIVRKITMDEILTGNIPPFEEIIEYCKTEKLQSGKSLVGFKQ